MKNKLVIVFLLAMTLTFGTVGIASASETLVFAISLDVGDLNPGNTSGVKVVDNIFEGLVKFKAGTTSIQPCLATSWEISADGKEITFRLRKGVKFHDGTDFNANAVVFFPFPGNMTPIILTTSTVNGLFGDICLVI